MFNKDKFKESLNKALNENFSNLLSEKRVVTFNGETFPESGWCVIMAGAGGSGKGYALNYNIPINGKVINVDHYKKLYNKNMEKMKDSHIYHDKKGNAVNGYDLTDPLQTDLLHKKVAQKDWKNTEMYSFFDSRQNGERKDNIIFDITGKSSRDLVSITRKAQAVGYKTMIIWIVASREMAMARNNKRARTVPQSVLDNTRCKINNFLPSWLKMCGGQAFDDAWILFSSGVGDTEVPDTKDVAFRLVKNGNGFAFPEGVEERLNQVLGINQSV